MRAFLAVALPEEIRASLAALQRGLAQSGADVTWVAPEHLHVTMKFLDDISEEQRTKVETLVAGIAGRQPRFALGMEQVGAFPSLAAPRVIWAGLGEGTETLGRLAQEVEQEGRHVPLRTEERPFAAHVTLGRVRSPRRRWALVEALQSIRWEPPRTWEAAGITLYRSDLSSAGPRYTVLAECPFAGPR
jgi:2'-5' RNA ligase